MESLSVRRALALSAVARIGSIAIGFAGVMMLARLLTPVETGIFSVSAAVVTLAHALRDFGITAYLNQERELTPARIATALGLALIVGWTIGAFLLAISEPAALWYAQPGVGATIRVLAIGFFIIPIGSAALGILYRDMRFREIAYLNLGSTFVQTLSAIGFAAAGTSYMSLAYANLLGLVTNIVGLVIIKAPHLFIRPTLGEWRRVTGFSIFACASLLIQYGGRMAPDLIVGRFLGIAPVAYLSRANGLTDMFRDTTVSMIQPVAFSAFAAAHREGGTLKAGYLRAMTLYTGVAWPFYAVLAIAAFPVIRLLYGSQWDLSVLPLRILCAAGALTALSVLAGQALYAVGQPRRLMWREGVSQSTLVVFIVIAAQFSLWVVAWALVAGAAVAFLSAQYHLSLVLSLRMNEVARATVGSLALTFISIAPAAAILHWLNWQDYGALATTALIGVCSTVFWVAGVFIVNHPLRGEIKNAVQTFLQRAKALRSSAASRRP